MKKAVALKYPKNEVAPFISASAKGELAERIVSIAKEHSIPVVEDVLLSDILSSQEIGSFIPEETWKAVAAIFAFVIKTQKKNKMNEE